MLLPVTILVFHEEPTLTPLNSEGHEVEPDGKTAVRTQVKLGRSSVSTVEILDGLKPGDEVILSDMSRWDAFDRIRLQ